MADKMNFSSTMLFTSEEIRRENLKQLLSSVSRSLEATIRLIKLQVI